MASTSDKWQLDQSDGQLLIRTGIEGRAAKMGHRLTIAMNTWHATVGWSDGEPAEVTLTVDVDSLEVLSGEGGITPMAGPEKKLARSNALKVFDAKRFPQIVFETTRIEKTSNGYRLTGTVQIHGKSREQVVELDVTQDGDVWHMSCQVDVRHSDFGMKPYSQLMGSMKVADTVTVSFTAQH